MFNGYANAGGPNRGHDFRQQGSPKKTFKKIKYECTEDEIEAQWTLFKNQLEDVFNNQNSEKYDTMDPDYLIDTYLKPKLLVVQQILIDEDISMGGQQGQIGECMEFCIRENVFMEVLAFA